MTANAIRNNLICPNCHIEALVSHDGRRFTCSSCGHTTARTTVPKKIKLELQAFKRLFVTCAVEGQPVNAKALQTALNYCKVTGAEFVCVPRDYYLSQPNVMHKGEKRKRHRYAKALIPYLRRPDWLLNKNLMLRGSAYMSPTNQNVLSGKGPLAAGHSLILAHPQQAQEFFYGGQSRGTVQIITTGAITSERYSASEVGDKAEFHHVLGGLIVEIKNDKVFYVRHVGFAKDGSFIDMADRWTTEGAPEAAPRLPALVFGDLHCADRVKAVFDEQFRPGGLADTLKPLRVMLHDALDGFFINNHKSIFELAAGHDHLKDTADEIDEFVHLMQRLCLQYPDTKFIAVGSNHTDWFTRWAGQECKSTRRSVLLLHSRLRAWLFEKAVSPKRVPEAMDFVAYLIDMPNFSVLHSDDQLEVLGTELSLHGHRGPLGARGNINTFAKLGVKVISGHRHQAGRKLGAMVVGTCGPLEGGYRHAIDAATHSHGLLYASKKRTLVSYFGGAFYIPWRSIKKGNK